MRRTRGRFAASRARAVKLLDDLALVSDTKEYPDYSGILASDVRSKPYTVVWKSFLQGGLYDVRLVDESLVQFVEGPAESFSFYDSPVKAISFEQYAADQLGLQWADDAYRDLLSDVREEYEEYLGSLDFERPATPVRYDYSPGQYRCACHPAAHLHFGFSSEVRVATRRRWNPEAFVMFVVRQFFPSYWDICLDRIGIKTAATAVREDLEHIADESWGDRHEAEVYFV